MGKGFADSRSSESLDDAPETSELDQRKGGRQLYAPPGPTWLEGRKS